MQIQLMFALFIILDYGIHVLITILTPRVIVPAINS